MKKISIAFFLFTVTIGLSQTTSVFDANLFNINGQKPLFIIGNGFAINDPFKSALECFTPLSVSEKNLISINNNMKKSELKVCYFKSNSDYLNSKMTGISGKMPFFSLASLNAEYFEDEENSFSNEKEILIFTMNYDFGAFKYKTNPILNENAKKLISNKSYSEFIDKYGSHYINGYIKEWFLKIKLIKSSKNEESLSGLDFGLNANIPYFNANIGVTEKSKINKFLSSNEFSLEIESSNFDVSLIQDKLQQIINATNINDKYTQIINIISTAQKNATLPNSEITRYYYAPFTLYGVEGINWDVKKQNKLIEINENLYKVICARNEAKRYKNSTATDIYTEEIEPYFLFSTENKNIFIQKFLPNIIKFYNSNYQFLEKEKALLEKIYENCALIICNPNESCCNVNYNNSEFLKYRKYEEDLIVQLESNFENILNEEVKPDCQKNNKATISVINKSINPYTLYYNNKAIKVLNGGETYNIEVLLNNYAFKAVQNSGFVVYPTTNNRNVNAIESCEIYQVFVGFED